MLGLNPAAFYALDGSGHEADAVARRNTQHSGADAGEYGRRPIVGGCCALTDDTNRLKNTGRQHDAAGRNNACPHADTLLRPPN